MGRSHIPSALRIVRGTEKRIKPARKKDPVYDPIADAPKDLTEPERKYYDEYAAMFCRSKVATVVALTALGMLAKARVKVDEFRRQLDTEGYSVTNPRTMNLQINPIAVQLRFQETLVLKLLKEFGATPTSRPGVSVETSSDDVWQSM